MLAPVILGAALEAVAIIQQLAWHAAHRDAEPFGDLLVAHAGIYLGAALGAWGAWRAFARTRRVGFAVIALAGAGRIVAVLADAWAHARALDPLPAHDLYRLGIGLAALGALAFALPFARRLSAGAR